MSDREPIGVIGTGYVGLVTAAGFAELGQRGVVRRHRRRPKIAAPRARARSRSTSRGSSELVASTAIGCTSRPTWPPALEHARLLFVAVGTPPTYSGDADLSAVHAVVDAMPRLRPPRAGDEVDGAGAGRARRSSAARRAQGKEGFRYVSCPEFLKEGTAVADFREPDRVVVGDDGDWAGDAVVDLYAPSARRWCAPTSPRPRWSSSHPTRSWRPRSRSSTRSPTSARRPARTCMRGRARDGPRRPHRPEVPARRDRIRRLLLPEGRERAEAARR